MIFRHDADLQERDFGLVPRARSPPFLHELASFCANRLNLLATSPLTSALRQKRPFLMMLERCLRTASPSVLSEDGASTRRQRRATRILRFVQD